MLPSIGAIGSFKPNLQPLTGLINIHDYNQPWPQLMKIGGTVYAVPVKVDIKSLIWYDPAMFPAGGVPKTWSQLQTFKPAVGSPWCLALSSTPTSGWPGTDWISDIMLSMYGPGIYQQWVSGKLSWTSPQVEQAWETWGSLITGKNAVYNGLDAAMLTDIGSGLSYPTPGKCYLQHGTLVDEGYPMQPQPTEKGYPKQLPPTQNGPSSLAFETAYKFFTFPSIGSSDSAIQVSADFMGMFNPTPQAKEFIRFMTCKSIEVISEK